MYPELITRPDLKVFLPPIGGISVYIFGNASYISGKCFYSANASGSVVLTTHSLLEDPTKKLTLRVHDECNGSDVFGSDICTCRPYLIFGMEECVKQAQQGGVGVIVYCTLSFSPITKFTSSCLFLFFTPTVRKEGRALGEVTKYLVYNARK